MQRKISLDQKKEEFRFIDKFNRITISDICKKHGYSLTTISTGHARVEHYEIIKKELIKRLKKLLESENYVVIAVSQIVGDRNNE